MTLRYLVGRVLSFFTPAFVFATAFCVALVAFAQPLDPEKTGLDGLAKIVYDAVVHKNWALLAAVLLSAAVWLVRKYLGQKIPFLQTKLGGVLTMLVGTSSGALATALMAPGATFTPELLLKALEVGFMAAGGWSILKSVWEHFTVKAAVAAGAAAANDVPGTLNR